MLLLLILLAIFLFVVISDMVTKQKAEEQRSIAEKNHVLVTEKDIAESDRLMQTELFQELAKQIREKVTNAVFNYEKELVRIDTEFTRRHMTSIEVRYGQDEDDFGVSDILGVYLERMGYKPIKNYDQIRVLFYSIGRLEGFYFEIYPGNSVSFPELKVKADAYYWQKIYHQEQVRLKDEKNASLKDFF